MQTARENRVLVIDDDLLIRRLLATILSSSGRAVDLAENGSRGFQRLTKANYDLIISDVNMPVMDGLSLYKKIKEEVPGLERKILFLTADEGDHIMSFFSKNDCEYLYKPFRLADLWNKVGIILEKEEVGYGGKNNMSEL